MIHTIILITWRNMRTTVTKQTRKQIACGLLPQFIKSAVLTKRKSVDVKPLSSAGTPISVFAAPGLADTRTSEAHEKHRETSSGDEEGHRSAWGPAIQMEEIETHQSGDG